MKTVKEVSLLTGVSIRALHHYDAIGLLKPSKVTEAGYRLYDDNAVEQLYMILVFREFGLSLTEIADILHAPDYDRNRVLEKQISLMQQQIEKLQNRIDLARGILLLGVNNMNFDGFDTKNLDEYSTQAKALYGKTDAYKEYEQRGKNDQNDAMMAIFAEVGRVLHLDPASAEAQALVGKLQQFITDNYYTCTKQILQGLGQMYVADERFKANIDRAGGEGTAEFVAKAIEIYCK